MTEDRSSSRKVVEVVDRSWSNWQKTEVVEVVDSSSRKVVVVNRSRSSWQKTEVVEVVDSSSREVLEVENRRGEDRREELQTWKATACQNSKLELQTTKIHVL